MTAPPLSFAALWRDTIADTRALLPLAWPVAAAFVLLPQVAVELLGPPLPAPQAARAAPATRTAHSAAAASAVPATSLRRPAPAAPLRQPAIAALPTVFTPRVVFIDLVVPSLIALVAQGTIVRLALDRRGGVQRTVGEGLTAALKAWPPIVIAVLLAAMPVAAGLLLLIVPGLYVAGRLGLTLPLVLDGARPVAAIERSWALTAGNGWRVIGFTLLLGGWFIGLSTAAAIVGGATASLLGAAGAAAIGAVAASVLGGVVAAVFAVVNAVGLATMYRLLR